MARRKNTSHKRRRRIRTVHNPAPRAHYRRHKAPRRRRNGAPRSSLKTLGIALLAGAGGLWLGSEVMKRAPESLTASPEAQVLTGSALALLGGMALAKTSLPAAIGVAGGLGGYAAFNYLSQKMSEQPEADAPSVPAPTGAVMLPTGAVEIPVAGLYDPQGDGMIGIDDGDSYDD